MAGLLTPPSRGRPPKLSEEAKRDLQAASDSSRVATLRQACSFVQSNNGTSISQVAMHYYFKQQKVKKKTGRPTNVRKGVQAAEAFKKNLS